MTYWFSNKHIVTITYKIYILFFKQVFLIKKMERNAQIKHPVTIPKKKN
jgi:hypothetical protein